MLATSGALITVALGLLGGACLVLQSPVAWLVAGVAWVGAALMRLPSLLLDTGRYPKALGGFALELAVGLLLLSGAR